jgi:hypothetical protein
MINLKKISHFSLWEMIKISCKDHLNKFSSTRINGYWMSILFTICVLCCVVIEIISAITQFNKEESYVVSNQLIAICVLILGQQALLFNLKRKSEDTPFPTVEKINETLSKNGLSSNIDIDVNISDASSESEVDIIK